MKISIITACYNSAPLLSTAMESLRRQEYSDLEYIVVDGGSSDDTKTVVEKNSDLVSTFVSEPDKGLYDALNKGIGLATGDVIGLLHADDMYAHEEVLATIASAFEDPSVDACYGDLVYVRREDPTRVVRYWRSYAFKPGLIEKGWYPAHPTLFVRREVYQKYGLFDLDLDIAADVEMMMRLLARHRIKSVYFPEVLVRMRLGGASNKSIRSIIKQNIEIVRAFRRNQLPFSPFFFFRKLPNRVNQFIARPPKRSDP